MIKTFSMHGLPSARRLYRLLAAGTWLKIDASGIGWDEDFEALVGTNAYGLDYVWGALTLANVERWRQRLIASGEFGFCPQLPFSNPNVTMLS